MSNSKALNDEEVAAEMKKMIAFIRQEATEKAREIKVKADEEFAIAKAKLVRQESKKIDETYEKKRKQVELGKKIEQSKLTNNSRLRILEKREELLQNVFEESRKKLSGIVKNDNQYTKAIEGLILEGLYSLLEPKVKVLVRPKDVKLAKKALDKAVSEYEKNTSRTVEVEIAEELSDNLSGGVKLTAIGGRIVVDNTFEARLAILEDKALPDVRTKLFGPSETRKHYT